MISMNLMVTIKVELVAISLFALTLGIQQNMKYIIILSLLVFHYLERKVSRSNIPLGIGNGDHEGAKIRR